MFQTIIKIKYYDEIEKKEAENTIFLYADGFRDAIERICKWYGEDNIIGINLEFFEEGYIEVDEEFIERLRNND